MTGIVIIHVDYSTSQSQNFAISFAWLSNHTTSKYCYPYHDFPNTQFQNFTNPPHGVFLDIELIIPRIIFSGERQKLHVNYNYYCQYHYFFSVTECYFHHMFYAQSWCQQEHCSKYLCLPSLSQYFFLFYNKCFTNILLF